MTKEKLIKLERYLVDLTNKQTSLTIPAKHTHRVATYKQFIQNEINAVKKVIEEAKLEGVGKK